MLVTGGKTTLQEYVEAEWQNKSQIQGLNAVILAIAEGSRQVQQQVQQAALADALGTTGETNCLLYTSPSPRD